MGPTTGWRTISKLSVRSPNRQTPPTIGIFAPGSHDVVPLLSSPAHHPSINVAVQITTESAKRTNVMGYNGVDHGGLSYIGVNIETATGRVSLVLVWNAAGPSNVSNLESFVQDLVAAEERAEEGKGLAVQTL